VIPKLLLFDDERHFQALELLSMQSLQEGDASRAFRFVDRRCRIPPLPKALHFTLRGETLYQMGYADSALADIARALELAPDDLSANRRMLAWGQGEAKMAAARRLLMVESDFPRIMAALGVLRQSKQHAFAAVESTDRFIKGWAVWHGRKRVHVEMGSDREGRSERLVPDPEHPLAWSGANAASFVLEREPSTTSQRVAIYEGKTLFYTKRVLPNLQSRKQDKRSREPKPSSELTDIIIPVFADFDATKACFESLSRALKPENNARVIVIDDASQDPDIKRLLRTFSREPQTLLLTNEQNVGFAESVNRGLKATKGGDVILLNADTVVPPGFISRLRMAAYSAPDIATVTPLTNNGEFTSFPVPFRQNPLRKFDEICEIDAIAARVNAGKVIDMPNGIGFCLYVTRTCLNAVGDLSHSFNRGYFEDVELCLRAGELGFRNVCAGSVYVGHAGSRSFGAEKRSLVVRNLETIELAFPRYRFDCAAFLEADPLRAVRASVELSFLTPDLNATLLITGAGLVRLSAEARARELSSKGENVLIVELQATAAGSVMTICNPSSGIPQSTEFNLFMPAQRDLAFETLRKLKPTRVEIADPVGIPSDLVDEVLKIDCPIDLLITDGGIACHRGDFDNGSGHLCDAPSAGRQCDECLFGFTSAIPNADAIKEWAQTRNKLMGQVRRIYAPDEYAKSLASRFIRQHEITELKPVARVSVSSKKAKNDDSRPSIGIVVIGAGTAEYQLVKKVALAMNRELPERTIVVIGQTIDDIGLMKLDNVYVTGATESGEAESVLKQYAIGALFLPIKQPLFGHPRISELAGLAPTAYFDWSFGEVKPRPDDLALNPHLTEAELEAALVTWLA
jgi:GT2 family glycosyltransferase